MRRRLSSDGVTIAGGACAVLAVVLVLVLSVAAGPAAAAPLGTITIETPQACQVLQRDDAGVADMVVAGSCSGFNGPVEVRWGSGPWQTVDCALDGSFRTVLPSQPAGQASLTVRSALFPDVATACANVSVGDIYVIAGQSNASGRSPTLFTCADPVLQPALFGNDDCWRRLADPVDSSVGQVDRVSADRDAGGSVWPLVAQYLMADERVPVAFVPCAHVGSRIDRWQRDPWTPQAPGTLYGSMLRRIKAVGGRVRAVLFWQGEADAACRTPRSTYAALLRRLGDDVQQDCGAPLVAAQIGDYGPRYSGSAVDAVRLAQQSCWGTSNVLAGPVLYDIDLGGHIHFLAGGDVARAARRWTAAILEGVLSRPAARPPMLRSATWNGRRTIVLAVDPGIALLAPGPARGFVVRSGGRTVPVTAGVVRSNGTVQLTLSVAVTRPPTVSLGSGHSAAGADVPAEPSAWHLPMLMFVDRRVVIAAH